MPKRLMKEEHFQELLASVEQMGQPSKDQKVLGVKVTFRSWNKEVASKVQKDKKYGKLLAQKLTRDGEDPKKAFGSSRVAQGIRKGLQEALAYAQKENASPVKKPAGRRVKPGGLA